MKRTVFLIILIIFAVMTPAWSEVKRNTNIYYVLDLYKKVESFGFYENPEGTTLIGTGTVDGTLVSGDVGTSINNPFEIKSSKQENTPQYYFIIRSNRPEHNYDFKLTVSTFNNGDNSIGYKLTIRDMDDINFKVASEEIKGEEYKNGKEVELKNNILVSSNTKPDEWVWGFYYIFDDELDQAAEGEYIATVKMEVTVQ